MLSRATADVNGAPYTVSPDVCAGLSGTHVIAVHEVEERVVGDAVPERVRLRLAHAVPAHLRHLEARAVVLQLAFELESARPCRAAGRGPAYRLPRSSRTASARRRTRPAAACSRDGFHHGFLQAGLAEVRMQSGIAPWPGSTTRSAARIASGCSTIATSASGAALRQCLIHRAQVAHSVIHNRYRSFHFKVRQQRLQSVDDEFHRQRRQHQTHQPRADVDARCARPSAQSARRGSAPRSRAPRAPRRSRSSPIRSYQCARIGRIDDHRADRARPGQQRNRQRHDGDAVLQLRLVALFRRRTRVLPICAFSMLIAISSMMMPPPTSSEPTEIPKNAMICCPSSVVTAITQNTEIDAMRIVLRFSNVATVARSGSGKTGSRRPD